LQKVVVGGLKLGEAMKSFVASFIFSILSGNLAGATDQLDPNFCIDVVEFNSDGSRARSENGSTISHFFCSYHTANNGIEYLSSNTIGNGTDCLNRMKNLNSSAFATVRRKLLHRQTLISQLDGELDYTMSAEVSNAEDARQWTSTPSMRISMNYYRSSGAGRLTLGSDSSLSIGVNGWHQSSDTPGTCDPESLLSAYESAVDESLAALARRISERNQESQGESLLQRMNQANQ